MLTIRRAQDRGHADHGWLDTHHTFSFADYYDPAHMGFRALRVINDDTVEGGQGFGKHGHRDMEIISYVLDGALAHEDSTGTGETIRPGDVQRMSAGSGVMHSEYNASKKDAVHFLQIWLMPDKKGIVPSYEQKRYDEAEKRGKLRLVASPDARDGSLTIHTDALVYAGLFDKGERSDLSIAKGRHAWIHVARGNVKVNDQPLGAGDGIAVSDETSVKIEGVDGGEVIAFDLA